MKKPILQRLYDPIEEFIGRQLASTWRDPRTFIKTVKQSKLWWKYMYNNETRSIKSTYEDDLIEAVDKAHFRTPHRRDVVGEMIAEGMTEGEIATILGMSDRTVRRDIKKLKEELNE